jgi:hypothetical protein
MGDTRVEGRIDGKTFTMTDKNMVSVNGNILVGRNPGFVEESKASTYLIGRDNDVGGVHLVEMDGTDSEMRILDEAIANGSDRLTR